MDESSLDHKYFIDPHVYNCPYCNRRNVSYGVTEEGVFDWNNEKKCYWYTVECQSCLKRSQHFSFNNLITQIWMQKSKYNLARFTAVARPGTNSKGKLGEIDSHFFHSIPGAFFLVDTRIPRILRELLSECQECLRNNLLTGASACARKLVYELAVDKQAVGSTYEDRLKSLKSSLPDVDPSYFDTLLTIQSLTSTKVHEQSYDGWKANHLKIIVSNLVEILNEIYVTPAVRIERRNQILKLRDDLEPKAAEAPPPEDED